jgi:outer membrane receptor protein involved in Fe transport
LPRPAQAEDPTVLASTAPEHVTDVYLSDIVIRAPRAPEAASETEIPASQIQAIPTQIDSADILRTVPGLQIAQHAGGGKANEYMLRGFYADHGTDIAFSADGLPLNLVSHAHGQGYTDLHMIIPETVEDVEVEKGPYDAQQGDLGTAGSVRLHFYDKLPENFLDLTGGSFDTGRVAAGINLPGVLSRSYLVVDDYRTDGYVQNDEDYKRLNLFWKGTEDLSSRSKLTFLGTSLTSSWYASGLIPSRAVDEGLISQWGAIDPTQGGSTERHNLSVTYDDEIDAGQQVEVQAYYTRYILQLFSNFTFFLNNPVYGDGIEQDDNRNLFGGHAQYVYTAPVTAGQSVTTIGVESRNDSVLADLWNQEDRIRISSVSISDIWEQSVGVYAKEEIPLTSRLRFMGGLRYDDARFTADGASGTDDILSPKASFIYAASPTTELFANYGRGFHSNDARTAATDPESGLVRAEGAEVGVRQHALDDRLFTSLVFWGMDLDSELVLDQDTGGTEPSGRSRRAGIESEWAYEVTSWLRSDLDLDFSQAKYRDTGGDVPLAVNHYITGGLTAQDPSGWFGSLRFRDVGSRWGDDARTIPLQAYCIFDALVGYRRGHWGYQLAVDNIANTTWRDGQEVFDSRLQNEVIPTEDVEFTPGNPRTFLFSAKYYF